MNVFSIGMDDLAAKIRPHGIVATVHNHSDYEALAEQAARDYKAGEEGPLVIIGHSLGADADGQSPRGARGPGEAGRAVNLYISGGVGRASRTSAVCWKTSTSEAATMSALSPSTSLDACIGRCSGMSRRLSTPVIRGPQDGLIARTIGVPLPIGWLPA